MTRYMTMATMMNGPFARELPETVDLGCGVRLQDPPEIHDPKLDRFLSEAAPSYPFGYRVLVTEYEAESLEAVGPDGREYARSAARLLRLAECAAWFARPTRLTFDAIAHFSADPTGEGIPTVWRYQDGLNEGALLYEAAIAEYPESERETPQLGVAEMDETRAILSALVACRGKLAIASELLWESKYERLIEVVYTLRWMALEGLFGLKEPELTHQLASRIAWLIAPTPEAREDIYDRTREAYGLRSDILHGELPIDKEKNWPLVADTTAFARQAMVIILKNEALRDLFDQTGDGAKKRRKAFLRGLTLGIPIADLLKRIGR
jgi:hypothetical protein